MKKTLLFATLLSLWLGGIARAQRAPSAPTNLTGSAPAYNQVILNWIDNANNETKFEIEKNDFTWQKIGEVNPNITTYTDNSAGNGSTYRVRAVGTAGNSGYSNEFTISTPSQVPDAPTGLSASAQSQTGLRLTWANGGGGLAVDYLVERAFGSGGRFSEIATVPYSRTPSYDDNGRSAGTEYCYRVRARNAGGTSGYSNPACATTQSPPTPSAPTDLSANAISTSQINLSWNTSATFGDGYEVERADNPGGPFSKIADVDGFGNRSYSDQNRNASTQYCYRVRAKYQGQFSGFSSTVCATTQAPPVTTPNAPTRLAASAVSASQINLSWVDNASDETGYEVERGGGSGGPFSKIADLGPNAISYTDPNRSASIEYCYRVRAVRGGVASTYDGPACSTTPAPPVVTPPAPTELSANAVSTTQINLAWTSSATFGDYEIERAASAGGPFTKLADVTGSGNRSYSDQNLNASTQYCYRVRATYQGQFSGFSNPVCATTPAPPVTAPTAPARLTATALSASQVALSWADLSNNETGFELERAPASSGPFSKIADLPADATSFSDQNLSASTPYCYRIRAKNSAGASAFSDPACATTLAPPITIPAAPSDLTATAASSTQVLVAWKDNSTDEAGFELERAPSLTAIFEKIADLGANVTTYTDNGRSASTAYCYRVRARNSAGASAFSTAACATTPAPPVTIPKAPTGLAASAASVSQITLTWTDNAPDETGFDLERGSDGVSFSKITDLPANANAYADNGLAAATRYFYRLRAKNAAGASGYSNVADATTLLPVPAAPIGLKAELADYDQIRLTWTPGSANATGYVVERSLNGSTGFSPVVELPLATTYLDLGLQELTQYFYRVRARNAAGASPYSEVVSLKTPETVVGLEPEVPPGWVSVLATTGEATVHFAPHVAGDVGLQLFDLKGKVWIRHAAVLVAGGAFTFRTEVLPSGLYVILAETNQGVLRTKLIKP